MAEYVFNDDTLLAFAKSIAEAVATRYVRRDGSFHVKLITSAEYEKLTEEEKAREVYAIID